MRCLALGQAWQDAGGRVVFALAQATAAIESRLRGEGFEVVRLAVSSQQEDAEQGIELAHSHSARWVVVDGCNFDASYQQGLKNAGLKVLLVDDSGGAPHYFADLVLNQNVYAREELYSRREAGTRLLLGPGFAMLRREFAAWREWQREIAPGGNKLLITMGGSDPDNLTLTIIEALCLVEGEFETAAVVGGSNPHLRSLELASARFPGQVRILRDVPMPELMTWADAAICGAGTTAAEICFLGLPAILVDIAPNQTPVARELDRRGAALHMSPEVVLRPQVLAKRLRHLLSSFESRAAISKTARSLVDGRGAERVVSVMCGRDLSLRPAGETDRERLWEWANDPAVRAASFRQELIPWERHVEWFRSQLGDRCFRIYIALDSSQNPIGAVRFQLEGERAVVSITVDKKARGKGYGGNMLQMAAQELFQSSPAVAVDAYVKADNEASQRLFESAGFRKRPSLETVHGHRSVHFVLANNGAQ